MHRRLVPSKLSGLVWLATLAAVVAITWHFRGARQDFRGIAEDAKTSVSSESGVELLALRVEPGQLVKVGDTLLQLRNAELSLRIASIQREIEGASGEANLDRSESMRRAMEIRSKFAARKAELLAEIRLLSEQSARNRTLVSGFKDLGIQARSPDTAGIEERIRTLQEQVRVEEAGVQSQIALLEGSKGDIDRLAQAKNEALLKELSLLREQEKKLAILSPADGVVDSVRYRPGEKISPFSRILTISGTKPSRVRAYIPERVHSTVAVGDSVTVSSIGMRPAHEDGVVVGVGARIMEFPARMWKIPQYPVWGREVIIQIPSDNPLLLGELVAVHQKKSGPAVGGP